MIIIYILYHILIVYFNTIFNIYNMLSFNIFTRLYFKYILVDQNNFFSVKNSIYIYIYIFNFRLYIKILLNYYSQNRLNISIKIWLKFWFNFWFKILCFMI